MFEVVPNIAHRRPQMRDNPKGGKLDPAGDVRRRILQKSYCTNVSPPLRGGAIPAPLPSGEQKWRGNFPEESDHPVTPNRLPVSSVVSPIASTLWYKICQCWMNGSG